MAGLQSVEGLRESYARWRASPLGQITDRLEQQLLFELAGSVAGKMVLDVGCGDGALASELARRGAIVTGLDADPAMIAAARRRTEIEAIQLHLVIGELGRRSSWAAYRRIRGWLGHPTWRAARFRTAFELSGLLLFP